MEKHTIHRNKNCRVFRCRCFQLFYHVSVWPLEATICVHCFYGNYQKSSTEKRDMQIKGKNWISKKSENQHFSLSTAKYCLPPMLSQLTNGWCHILIWIFSFWHLVYSEGRPRLNIYVMRELCLIANILLSGIFFGRSFISILSRERD